MGRLLPEKLGKPSMTGVFGGLLGITYDQEDAIKDVEIESGAGSMGNPLL